MDDVYLDRSGVVNLLSERLDKPSDISRIVGSIEACFILQADEGRCAYIFEIDDDINTFDLLYLDNSLRDVGVCAVFIPKGLMSYVATVKPEDFDADDKISVGRAIKEFVEGFGRKILEDIEDER